jgi:hypothetical protein
LAWKLTVAISGREETWSRTECTAPHNSVRTPNQLPF